MPPGQFKPLTCGKISTFHIRFTTHLKDILFVCFISILTCFLHHHYNLPGANMKNAGPLAKSREFSNIFTTFSKYTYSISWAVATPSKGQTVLKQTGRKGKDEGQYIYINIYIKLAHNATRCYGEGLRRNIDGD